MASHLRANARHGGVRLENGESEATNLTCLAILGGLVLVIGLPHLIIAIYFPILDKANGEGFGFAVGCPLFVSFLLVIANAWWYSFCSGLASEEGRPPEQIRRSQRKAGLVFLVGQLAMLALPIWGIVSYCAEIRTEGVKSDLRTREEISSRPAGRDAYGRERVMVTYKKKEPMSAWNEAAGMLGVLIGALWVGLVVELHAMYQATRSGWHPENVITCRLLFGPKPRDRH